MLLFLRLIVVVMEYCRIFLSAGTQSPFRYGNIFQSCGPALFVPGQDRSVTQIEDQQVGSGDRVIRVARRFVYTSVQFALLAESQREVLLLAFCLRNLRKLSALLFLF